MALGWDYASLTAAASPDGGRGRAGHPARPLGLAAAPGDGEVALGWTDPGDAAITKYQYNLRVDGVWGAWADVPGSGAGTTAHTVRGLVNGTVYAFAVRAVSAEGSGAPAATAAVVPNGT